MSDFREPATTGPALRRSFVLAALRALHHSPFVPAVATTVPVKHPHPTTPERHLMIDKQDLAEIDARIEAAIDKHQIKADTETVQIDARLSIVEHRLTAVESSLARLEGGIDSLRNESLSVREALTTLAVTIEAQKNSTDRFTQVATIVGLMVTLLGLVAIFTDLI